MRPHNVRKIVLYGRYLSSPVSLPLAVVMTVSFPVPVPKNCLSASSGLRSHVVKALSSLKAKFLGELVARKQIYFSAFTRRHTGPAR